MVFMTNSKKKGEVETEAEDTENEDNSDDDDAEEGD